MGNRRVRAGPETLLEKDAVMFSRRKMLSLFGTLGIGSTAVCKALAADEEANKEAKKITAEMVKDSEWTVHTSFSEQQRGMAADAMSDAQNAFLQFRNYELENEVAPPLVFVPFASPAAAAHPAAKLVETSDLYAGIDVDRFSTDESIAFASVRELGALLRAKKITSEKLTRLYLKRLRRFDPLLKCVVNVTEAVALFQSRQADVELQAGKDRGPLHGIPWGAKDLFAYPGLPTTWGVPQYRERVIDAKATVAQRLEDAGAVMVAKLATGPFAFGNRWFGGMTRNPWNPHQGAVGSSCGPAAAAAAGLVGFTVGTETMGSICYPSANCGLAGLRPTYGRVSRHGCMTLGWSLDKVGPICRRVDDCGLVLDALHGSDASDASCVDRDFVWPARRDLAEVRIGYFADDEKDDDAKGRPELDVLRGLGATLVPVERPKLPDGLDTEFLVVILTIESSAAFDRLTRKQQPKGVKFCPKTWAMGSMVSAIDYLHAQRLRSLLMTSMDKIMQQVDVLVGDEGPIPTNLTGHPKISVPYRFETKDGFEMPEGMMFIGRLFDESTLLSVAAAFEAAVGVPERRPDVESYLGEKAKFLANESLLDFEKLYDGGH